MMSTLFEKCALLIRGKVTPFLYHITFREPVILGALLVAVLSLNIFGEIVDEVLDGETRAVDQSVLVLFQDLKSSNSLFGAEWFSEMMRDITGLGGVGILTFITLVASFYLYLIRRYWRAVYVLCAVGLATLTSNSLKLWFARPRPDIVPHESYTYLPGFPSGHSFLSAVVYLILGAILAETQSRKRLKFYFIGLAVFIVFMIGLSRIYLGVHWPSDVLAGWMIGAAWATFFWAVAHYLSTRRVFTQP